MTSIKPPPQSEAMTSLLQVTLMTVVIAGFLLLDTVVAYPLYLLWNWMGNGTESIVLTICAIVVTQWFIAYRLK